MHHGQHSQKSRSTPQLQDEHFSLDFPIFQPRITFRRHQGQYRMNGINGPLQLEHLAVYRRSG